MFTTSPGLRFQLFGFPVRVHYSFFLIALLFGINLGNIVLILLWVAIVFVSILLHELGHAFAANHYGRNPSIELYHMGGLTVSSRYSTLTYAQEIFINAAGALAGFALGGLIFLLLRFAGPLTNPYLDFVAGTLMWVNVIWGIFNLVPMLPLDGGHIMRNLWHWLRNPHDERTPLVISVVFGVLGMITALILLRNLYLVLLLAIFTFNNFSQLR